MLVEVRVMVTSASNQRVGEGELIAKGNEGAVQCAGNNSCILFWVVFHGPLHMLKFTEVSVHSSLESCLSVFLL